ncbi:MAG: hypothetical protein JNK51_10120 [Blastocatellia bacterium]|nr:hypothetical protein [Chloracidobacterium sp.]MBL8185269.1 hypothetical protein [Blastocatellia bacterium]HRJ88702.1 hypothetical protein [Pyrinomonadaceae bacterium]HRK51266.1 hypothetical protein [Pyrinomonadaceae bacterium]
MGAKEQMIEILRSGETSRISFSFTGSGGTQVSLDGAAFRRVATALANGDLSVVEGRFTENRMVYAAWSDPENNYASNTFYLGSNPRWSRDFNALVVHESVHAFFDLSRTTIPWVDNEAAGYIAQAYYLRNSGYPMSRIELGSLIRLGALIVGDMTSGGDVTTLIDAIRDSLRNDPRYHSYINDTFTGNG